MCFAVPEKEVEAVAEALQSRFHQALDAGRLSQVLFFYRYTYIFDKFFFYMSKLLHMIN